MSYERIAKRYAKSIYQLAEERGELEAVKADFEGLGNLLAESRDLQVFLKSPVVDHLRKAAILHKLFKGQLTEIVDKFIDILARHARENVLPEVCSEFIRLYNHAHNLTPVTITSAAPLSATQRKSLLGRLAEALGTEILVSEEVIDESLIGGLKVRTREKLYDGSIASALRRLEKTFDQNLYIERQ